MICYCKKYVLHFRKPGSTSRGILHDKETYILVLQDGEKTAYGECNLFRGLSYDDRIGYDEKLVEVCQRLPGEKSGLLNELSDWPSIYMGVETVLKDWENGSRQIIFSEGITERGFTIPINGLIWMGSKDEMKQQIANKLENGYTSIKLKIGAIDFEKELELLQFIRNQFSEDEVEIRLDANGAFGYKEAEEKIKRISAFGIHYIEQPIGAGQWQEMARLVEDMPVKIALDEELIGIRSPAQKRQLLQTISPQMLILKPALIGGFQSCDEWRSFIELNEGNWVITSALESNIGLNAIAQYAAAQMTECAQGLGTGQLYTNNFASPYTIDASGLHYDCNKNWDFSLLQ